MIVLMFLTFNSVRPQTGKKGHSSVEDAQATMQLYRVVEGEWEKTLALKSQSTD